MGITTKLREEFIRMTGYWIYRHRDLPVGCDLFSDLKNRIFSDVTTIVDVGANVGQSAVKFNANFKGAKIYCFEPFTQAFEQLQINTAKWGNITCFKQALGSKQERMEIGVFEGPSSLNSLKEELQNKSVLQKEVIDVIPGDLFCQQQQIQDIDLLKIDTEGYEIQVLQGFGEIIARNGIKTMYCEVGFHPDNARFTYLNELMDFACKNNFTFFGLYEILNPDIRRANNFGNALFINNEFLPMLRGI